MIKETKGACTTNLSISKLLTIEGEVLHLAGVKRFIHSNYEETSYDNHHHRVYWEQQVRCT